MRVELPKAKSRMKRRAQRSLVSSGEDQRAKRPISSIDLTRSRRKDISETTVKLLDTKKKNKKRGKNDSNF